MDEKELQNLLITAVQVGMNSKRNGFNDTYLTDDMFGDCLELYDVSFDEFKECMDGLLEVGAVVLDEDDGGYVTPL